MKYLKVWTDFENVLAPLEYNEIGNLFLAMLHYSATGEEPETFIGNERFLWAVAKRDIDMAADRAETLRNNGLKGGRPKTKENQDKPTETKANQEEANESRKEKKRNEIKRNEIKRNEKESLLDEDEAAQIVSDHDKVLSAAENAGFARNDATRAKLIDLYAVHGLQKVLDGIGSCVDHGASNIAYLSAVLKGEPKKVKISKAGFSRERSYDDEQADAERRMIEGMKEAGVV